MKSIQTQAIINGVRSRKDGSLGVSFETPELNSKEKALFMELQGINLNLVITPLEDANPDIEKIDKELDVKKPSVRLRSVIFILWKQIGEKESFDEFYKNMMEKFIQHIKDKLEN